MLKRPNAGILNDRALYRRGAQRSTRRRGWTSAVGAANCAEWCGLKPRRRDRAFLQALTASVARVLGGLRPGPGGRRGGRDGGGPRRDARGASGAPFPGAARAVACDPDLLISGGAIFICCCRVAAPGRSRSA